MAMLRLLSIICLPALLLGACTTRSLPKFPPEPGEPTRTIHIVSHGWHTGIVMSVDDVPVGTLPDTGYFGRYRYVEVGWGDLVFYATPDAGVIEGMNAILSPTPSALHLVGFNRKPHEYFSSSAVVQIKLTTEGLENLCRFIAWNFDRDEDNRARYVCKGLYGNSRFYLGRTAYYFLETCNVWTAKALQQAGCPMTPLTTLTAESLMNQAAECGRVLQRGR
jgi:uncharacterized protein (TIGR02117 family)